MDDRADPRTDHDRRSWWGWWDATPAELVSVLVLVAGALVASVLWIRPPDTSGPQDTSASAPVAGDPAAAGRAVGLEDQQRGADRDHDDHGPGSPNGQDTDAAARPEPITVHVAGAVVTPGLVELPPTARVGDAVTAAGGVTDDGEPHRINLAQELRDGDHVRVPSIDEPVTSAGSASVTGETAAVGPVDVNRADVAELTTLPGIGPAKAQAIVEHRDQHGPFTTPGDLRAVPGIGEATFQRLASLIVAR